MRKFLITICARGGSKGIPGKNIKALNGKPLIAYTIDVAKSFKDKLGSVDIALSTDSEEIRKVAENFGLSTDYIRPDFLAGDKVGKIDAIKDLLLYHEKKNSETYEYILDLDVTSPLRNVLDLCEAYKLLEQDPSAINLFSVSDANRSPYFNMVEQKSNGYFAQVKRPEGDVFTRQSAPLTYDLNASFYFYRRAFFDLGYKGAITDKSLIYRVPHICFDLDHPIDFEIISYLITNNKLDFDL
ncbi:acylneuraminate cytidylyltransferase family protein [Parabacteroides timonensis]|uniref:acylneuraminate cytidylyltransferase family protein n=1 Tax=Parabacteroides timonensis TaxID=1871013 RepID=UPI00094EC2BB|nr:acylneuraminate cytidylyltransferase family protein [Parabacteroides timonensis]